MNKEEAKRFIGELINPIEPSVYAGYGSTFQNEISKVLASDNPELYLEFETRYISNFIGKSQLTELLDLLLELLVDRPTDYMNDLTRGSKEDWDYYVDYLLSEVGKRIPEITVPKLEVAFINCKHKRNEIIEILSSIENPRSNEALIRIRKQNDDLTNGEHEMINEFINNWKK